MKVVWLKCPKRLGINFAIPIEISYTETRRSISESQPFFYRPLFAFANEWLEELLSWGCLLLSVYYALSLEGLELSGLICVFVVNAGNILFTQLN